MDETPRRPLSVRAEDDVYARFRGILVRSSTLALVTANELLGLQI